jgi:RNA polymerase sigma-70 factor, ECF subfamily
MVNVSKVIVIEEPRTVTLTDDELVAATVAGDETAFAQLFVRHKRLVAGIAGRFFPRQEQIEEIMQTSFFNAYQALGRFQGAQENSFAAWLSRITANACFDELRRKQRRKENVFSDFDDDETETFDNRLAENKKGSSNEMQLISRDLAEKLLAKLKPEDRLAITLLYEEEWSVAEIGKFFGWSNAKVKGRAHRARHALQEAFKRLK